MEKAAILWHQTKYSESYLYQGLTIKQKMFSNLLLLSAPPAVGTPAQIPILYMCFSQCPWFILFSFSLIHQCQISTFHKNEILSSLCLKRGLVEPPCSLSDKQLSPPSLQCALCQRRRQEFTSGGPHRGVSRRYNHPDGGGGEFGGNEFFIKFEWSQNTISGSNFMKT